MKSFFWIIDLVLPVSMIVLSFLYKKKAKKKISNLSGFRTEQSCMSLHSWRFAHNLASKVLLIVGVALTVFFIILACLTKGGNIFMRILNLLISFAIFMGSNIYVENKTKDFNDKNIKSEL